MITSKQLNRLRDEAYATACNKGFHDGKHSDEHYLMLVITEIAEAVQADRKGLRADRERYDYAVDRGMCSDMEECFERYIKNSIEDELADIVIRLLDFCGMKGIAFNSRNDDFGFTRLTYKSKPFTDVMFDLCSMITGYDPNLEIIVRCVIYYCNVHGIDILWHIEQKMEYNRTRPRMHNAKY